MLTIRDIARQAGVSITTVSRALNNYPDVNTETRQRILDLVRELGYQPSTVARSLTTRRSWLLGVFYQDHVRTDLLHPFFQEVILGFKETAGEQGYDLVFFANTTPEGDGRSYLQRCQNRHVDGVVLMGLPPDAPGIGELARNGIPLVAVDLDVAGRKSATVVSDNVAGARMAVEHLVTLGHRRLAHICGHLSSLAGRERLKGYQTALSAARLHYDPQLVADGDWTLEGGYAAMRSLLDQPQRPTAVFAGGDLMAIGAIHALHDAGLRVPEDVAVIGFDDIAACAYVQPALSTIRQDKRGLGRHAAQELLAMVEDPEHVPAGHVLPVSLVARASCGGQPA